MKKQFRTLTATMMLATASAATFAGQPYIEELPVHRDRPNTAKVIVNTARHPEVAVSRTLAAQPVHPWMTQVQLNDTITTWIDPLQKLDGESKLARGHSLLRAQQLARDVMGITAADLQRAQAMRVRPAVLTNSAQIVARPNRGQPMMIIDMRPAPANDPRRPRPIPTTPQQAPAPKHQLAAR